MYITIDNVCVCVCVCVCVGVLSGFHLVFTVGRNMVRAIVYQATYMELDPNTKIKFKLMMSSNPDFTYG